VDGLEKSQVLLTFVTNAELHDDQWVTTTEIMIEFWCILGEMIIVISILLRGKPEEL
jgi:hypothetical protein